MIGLLYGLIGGHYARLITDDRYDYSTSGWHYAWQVVRNTPLTIALAMTWPFVMVYMKVKHGEVYP